MCRHEDEKTKSIIMRLLEHFILRQIMSVARTPWNVSS